MDNADAAGKPAAQAAYDNAKKKADDANAEKLRVDGILAGRRAALASIDRALTLAQATGSASASGTIVQTAHGPGDIQGVATAISNIVTQTFDAGNTKDFCTVLLADMAITGSRVNPDSDVAKTCVKLLGDGMLTVR